MEWLSENLWAMWLALALILATAELLTLDLTLLMLASGALAACLTSVALPGLWPVHALVGITVSFLMLFLLRPTLLKRVRNMPGYRSQLQRVVGSPGTAVAEITAKTGAVKVDGEVWSARSATGITIQPGDDVIVAEIDGVTAVVHPTHQSLQ